MKLDQKQIRLLVNLQASLEQKEVKFLVFHEDQKYTVTNELEETLNINSTIFVITSTNVVSLGPVLEETIEEIRVQVDMILSIVHNESLDENQMNDLTDLEIPSIEHPTYIADLFIVIARELEYDSGEIDRMLTILQRMLPIYVEYFQKNRKEEDLSELTFVAEKILRKMNKSLEAIEMFNYLLKEKFHFQQSKIEEQATSILTSLLIEKMDRS